MIINVFCIFIFSLFYCECLATPSVSNVTRNGDLLTISGSGFGTKTTPAPHYYSNFDNETTDSLPLNQLTNTSNWGKIKSNVYRGGKSLEWNYNAVGGVNQGDWARNVIDFGPDGAANIYISYWLYLDKGASDSPSWQWKNVWATSCTTMYVCSSSTDAFVGTEQWHFTDPERWGNSGSPHVYTGDGTLTTFSAPSDLYLWGQWQRIEIYLQRSEPLGTANGKIFVNRIGRNSPIANSSTVLTHKSGDANWRYISLSQAIESVYSGSVDLNIYMDDVYVDTSQARVEIGDAENYNDCTHREIQTPTLWSDTETRITLNQGSFADSSQIYVFLVDEGGSVSAGYGPITLGSPQQEPVPKKYKINISKTLN